MAYRDLVGGDKGRSECPVFQGHPQQGSWEGFLASLPLPYPIKLSSLSLSLSLSLSAYLSLLFSFLTRRAWRWPEGFRSQDVRLAGHRVSVCKALSPAAGGSAWKTGELIGDGDIWK
jgi:hypothetical protein